MAAGIACGGNPTVPTPPPPPPELPKAVCPAPAAVQSMDGSPVAVAYGAATSTGGVLPVTVACMPESGSLFPLGSTTVSCTATDAAQRTDSCTFGITVTAVPRISATRFVAFGDSITAGDLSFGRMLLISHPQGAYPTSLKTLLERRYTAQSFVITNAGVGGEQVSSTSGQARFRSALLAARPEVVLLMEGVNDLNAHREDAINDVIAGLRGMVQEAEELGVRVFLGTLLPQRPGGSRAFTVELIPEVNELIRDLAADEGADLVDLYEGFGGQAGTLIGDDGLHPNDAGYEKIAELFFAALRAKLEVPSTAP
jgi:lysophospholipase L1-like esterase